MRLICRIMATSAIVMLCHPSFGAGSTSTTLRLEDAVGNTLRQNPQLSGYQFKAQALRGERQTAELRPELRINTDLENIAGSGEFHGTGASELTISLSSVIEWPDQRDARLGVVTARQQKLISEQRLLMLNVVTAVTNQFIQLVSAQEQLKIHQSMYQLAEQTLDSIKAQSAVGKIAESDFLRAQAALSRRNLALLQAKQQVRSHRLKLSAYWADSSPSFGLAQADLYAIPVLPSLGELQNKLSNNPDLVVLLDDINVRTAAISQVRSEARSSVEWSAGVKRLQETKDAALVLGLSVPLGSTQRASGAITTATAEQLDAEQTHYTAQMQLQSELVDLFEQQQLAVNELSILHSEIIPALVKAQDATAQGFNKGRYSYLELSLAQNELLEAQQAYIEAAAQVQATRIALERIVGSSLTGKHYEVTP